VFANTNATKMSVRENFSNQIQGRKEGGGGLKKKKKMHRPCAQTKTRIALKGREFREKKDHLKKTKKGKGKK